MNWKALKTGDCPKCGKQLRDEYNTQMVVCSNNTCDFKIRAARLNELLITNYPAEYDVLEDNQRALNNL